ncbi:conserved hypothetical protein [Rippkaea orientalis PCC 8801]|uniref:Uncharacterized protein n=1 Tax=Rippkaea orientalis (strain PCC 8801 / RF-1) TaxID=41431 RepID=B7JVX0_RIPO1|nr:hypothetical protein [Rippkaea orientalis]ACK65659.1 conserved hypothetical protein [Rippkaea orientalis PCC 8801]
MIDTILIEGIDIDSIQVSSENPIQNLKEQLNNVFEASDKIQFEHLCQETYFVWQEVLDNSKSYKERSQIFKRLYSFWNEFCQDHKKILDIMPIDQRKYIEDVFILFRSYYCLFSSLALINESERQAQQVANGFLQLAETVDIFIEFFPDSQLNQLYDSCKEWISGTNRNIAEYDKELKENPKLSVLVTQIRSCSSLIILKIEEHFKQKESTIETETTQGENKEEIDLSSKPWWEQIVGTFADDSVYDEAMKLGREYRESLRPNSSDQ